jgi:hypothetical protein
LFLLSYFLISGSLFPLFWVVLLKYVYSILLFQGYTLISLRMLMLCLFL